MRTLFLSLLSLFTTGALASPPLPIYKCQSPGPPIKYKINVAPQDTDYLYNVAIFRIPDDGGKPTPVLDLGPGLLTTDGLFINFVDKNRKETGESLSIYHQNDASNPSILDLKGDSYAEVICTPQFKY